MEDSLNYNVNDDKYDVALTSKGRNQAVAVGQDLRTMGVLENVDNQSSRTYDIW